MKIVLAYSGGLDTSVIVRWLKENYQAEIIAFCANIGQEEELGGLEAKALKTGAFKCIIEDLQEEFARDFIFPMFQAGAIYEGQYFLGTSIARPLIAKRLVEIARLEKADALAHGATGKGNDQVRFELAAAALAPDLPVSAAPEDAPNEPEYVELEFERGNCVAVNGKPLWPLGVMKTLNKLGGKHGIGRVDMVENRFVGMKGRGVYETPGGAILHFAHRQIETLTMDREVMHLRDSLIPKYSELVYNGFWFSPEREALQALVTETQRDVTGVVRLKLYKGNVIVAGRKSPKSLYDPKIATMERDASAYDQSDATGFIRLNALRLKLRAARKGD